MLLETDRDYLPYRFNFYPFLCLLFRRVRTYPLVRGIASQPQLVWPLVPSGVQSQISSPVVVIVYKVRMAGRKRKSQGGHWTPVFVHTPVVQDTLSRTDLRLPLQIQWPPRVRDASSCFTPLSTHSQAHGHTDNLIECAPHRGRNSIYKGIKKWCKIKIRHPLEAISCLFRASSNINVRRNLWSYYGWYTRWKKIDAFNGYLCWYFSSFASGHLEDDCFYINCY